MLSFTANIQKFDKQGEKTGWTYIVVPEKIAEDVGKFGLISAIIILLILIIRFIIEET